MRKCFWAFLGMLALCASGREFVVDYQIGKQGNSGTPELPLPDFRSAIPLLKPGDVVRILPSDKPIRDTLRINELKGTAEKPITIDGMNNIFLGSTPLDVKQWQEVSPGLFRRQRKSVPNMTLRYYMIHKGMAVFMGRSTKGIKNPPFKKPEELSPGEWTVVDPAPGSQGARVFDFYVRLADGEKTPSDGRWEEPSLVSGVAIQSPCVMKNCGHDRCGAECSHVHCEYIQFRNIIVKHFWNDGFNIHGKALHLNFENVAAIECGDDGVSAHERGQITVRNFVSIRNSTGICHIQQAQCTHENVYIEGTRGVDFYPCKQSGNVLTNAYVSGDSRRGVVLAVESGGSVTMKNCYLLNRNPQATFGYTRKEPVRGSFENVQLEGYRNPCADKGIMQVQEGTLASLIAQKRLELFRLFGGQLEKACSLTVW